MDTLQAKELMVFDWIRAAQLIKERQPTCASAGLANDWEYTGDTIYENGLPITDSCTYLSSTWATPELNLDGDVIPCYRMESEVPDWGARTSWPPEALAILSN